MVPARASNSTVIARLDRATQYAEASRFKFEASGILYPRFRGDNGWCARMTAAACGRQGH